MKSLPYRHPVAVRPELGRMVLDTPVVEPEVHPEDDGIAVQEACAALLALPSVTFHPMIPPMMPVKTARTREANGRTQRGFFRTCVVVVGMS